MKTIAHCRLALSITILLLTTLLCAVGLTTPPLQAAPIHTPAAWDTPDTFQEGNQVNQHEPQRAETDAIPITPTHPNHPTATKTHSTNYTGSDQNIGGIDWQVIGVSRYEN